MKAILASRVREFIQKELAFQKSDFWDFAKSDI